MPAQEVLESNLPALTVFRYARADYLTGLTGGAYHGVSAVEIKAVASMVGARADEDLLWRIRILESAYGQEVNRRGKSRAGK